MAKPRKQVPLQARPIGPDDVRFGDIDGGNIGGGRKWTVREQRAYAKYQAAYRKFAPVAVKYEAAEQEYYDAKRALSAVFKVTKQEMRGPAPLSHDVSANLAWAVHLNNEMRLFENG